jgi:hypothetical protein
MANQNIDAAVSGSSIQTIKDALDVVKNNLPFLITLSAEERKSILKAGPDSLSFVTNARTASADYPQALPGSFDTAAFQRDCDLFAALTELQTLTESVVSQIDDTRLAVGGESMRQAMQAYEYFKTASKTTPGLKPVVDQLAERFKRSGTPEPPPQVPPPQP